MLKSGKRLVGRAGAIADIGIMKTNLTEEDLAIERGFDEIVRNFGPDHALYGEEEHDMFHSAVNVWTVDPISSTSSFIAGRPHYAIVVAHLVYGKAVFAAVYDPSVDEMFTAYKGKGAFLNDRPIGVSQGDYTTLFLESTAWKRPKVTAKARELLEGKEVYRNAASFALNYCWVASGKYDGIIAFTKDSFPEFAGGFILREAGGLFTNVEGESEIQAADRVFVGGNDAMYRALFPIIETANRS